jgi:hypothetical protein
LKYTPRIPETLSSAELISLTFSFKRLSEFAVISPATISAVVGTLAVSQSGAGGALVFYNGSNWVVVAVGP